EPQEGRSISTTYQLAQATMAINLTNFNHVFYQPLSTPSSTEYGANGPMLRLSPPDGMEASAPTVYWDLAVVDLNGTGVVNLDLSGVPAPEKLVTVSGQVRARSDMSGVTAQLAFLSQSLDGTAGLTASFSQSVATDSAGNYTAQLFAGRY